MNFGISQFVAVCWHTKSSVSRRVAYLSYATATVLASLGALPAWAYNPAHLLQLQNTGICTSCDLSNADLTTGSVTKIINVSGSNLKSANVSSRTDLAGTNFQGTDLSSAIFANSQGTGANFKNAVADGADFRQASFVNSKADGSSFVNAVLDDADFTGGFFYKANLTGASFVGTLAIDADFTQANITNADFSYSNISNANFQYASGMANSQYSGSFYETGVTPPPPPSLTDCTTGSQVRFNNTTAEGTNFSHTISEEFLGFNLKARGANFSSVSLCTAKVVRADLGNTNFAGAQINVNNLDNQGLIATQANFAGANFTDAYLLKADMTKANLTNAVFEKTNLGGAKLASAILKGVNWVHAYLKDVNLSGAKDASDSALSWADYLMGITLPNATKPQFCDTPTVLTDQAGSWSDRTIFGYSHNYSGCQVKIEPEGNFDFINIVLESLGLASRMIEVYAKDDWQFQNNLFGNTDLAGQKNLTVEKGAIVKFLTGFDPEKPGVKLTYNAVPTPTPLIDPKDDDGSKDDSDPKDDGGSNGDDDTGDPNENSTKVPEPGIGLGLAGLALAGWLRRKQGDRPNH